MGLKSYHLLLFLNWPTLPKLMNVYFQDHIQETSRGHYTQDLRDLISTSYFGDICRHIHNGCQMLPVKITIMVAIGRI